MMKAGIAGAGLVGRLLAFELLQQGWQVSLFDRDDAQGTLSCGYVAAGMLCPLAEIIHGESLIYELGQDSLKRWPGILAKLKIPECLKLQGSLMAAHPHDEAELKFYIERLQSKLDDPSLVSPLNETQVAQIEPDLKLKGQVYYLKSEGVLDNIALYAQLYKYLRDGGVKWFERMQVEQVSSGCIHTAHQDYHFDMVFDCRGFGAKKDYPQLRGVRGEVVWLQTSQVQLERPIRLVHPRYPLYVVPRGQGHYVIGASQIESEDFSAISVRTILELLTAVYSIHPGFAEARVVKTLVNCRPAFADNLPRIYLGDRHIAINGLFRNGYLLAPALVAEVMNFLIQGRQAIRHSQLVEEIS